MALALELASRGAGTVSPNPMVGAVIVHPTKGVIGSGWHKKYGEPHAEVNAMESVEEQHMELLKESTMYVNLEPCSHYGKTPPCCDLIIRHRIGRVVVGSVDSNPQVAGRGIQKIRESGIPVTLGVMEKEALELNKRFFMMHSQGRPYIILKWAQTSDGYMDAVRPREVPVRWMTSPQCKKRVHQWRATEDAIIVGRATAMMDNPTLTVRQAEGKNPIRIVMDRSLRLEPELNLFNSDAPTILLTAPDNLEKAIVKHAGNHRTEIDTLDFSQPDTISQLLNNLACRRVQSLIVEGGAELLGSFIEQNLWDQARIFTSQLSLSELYPGKGYNTGVKAPELTASQIIYSNTSLGLEIHENISKADLCR